ncbi:hypothetical protein K461DRAFT_74739 [Myriangium duriaei CBS 260.36]|uniref:Uncharacterized protein n=1 Tax=Myriangium duriaei CBS 260.36 TaxID=1168546 RepID=A0A9P4J5K7_9PEZI|nr:hypothetical protein K461DRAFT_74739 [Myriangium duriaei CBS 260.36]
MYVVIGVTHFQVPNEMLLQSCKLLLVEWSGDWAEAIENCAWWTGRMLGTSFGPFLRSRTHPVRMIAALTRGTNPSTTKLSGREVRSLGNGCRPSRSRVSPGLRPWSVSLDFSTGCGRTCSRDKSGYVNVKTRPDPSRAKLVSSVETPCFANRHSRNDENVQPDHPVSEHYMYADLRFVPNQRQPCFDRLTEVSLGQTTGTMLAWRGIVAFIVIVS